MNARSIFNKRDTLSILLNDKEPDLVLITETWNNPEVSNAMLSIDGYTIEPELRLDRQDTHNGIGGGVMVYVKNGLIVKPNKVDTPYNQMCSFSLKSDDGKDDLNFILYYRSPNCAQANTNYLEEVIKTCPVNTLMIGDLNMPEINWDSLTAPRRYQNFVNSTTEQNLTQLVGFSTHQRGNILDCAFTNAADKIIDIQPIGYLGTSDHTIISIDIAFGADFTETDEKILDWGKANVTGLSNYLNDIKWSDLMENENVEGAWNIFKGAVQSGIDNFVPLKSRRKRSSPPWLTKHVIKLTRKKQRLWDAYKAQKTADSFERYKSSEKDCKKAVSKAKKKFEKKLSTSNNPKPFNSYIKRNTKDRTGIGPLKSGDQTVCDPKDMAKILNDYFTSVYTKEDTTNIPSADQLRIDLPLDPTMTCSRQDVLDAIDQLKPFSAAGPDGLGSKLFKDHKDPLANALTILFNKSLSSGTVPSDWTKANVTPIFKKGKKGEASNYRPISLTSIPCKILERIIKKHLVNHLDQNNLIRPTQHGFTSHRSTVTNLLDFFETITSCIDEGNNMDVIYLDFSKAFDKVPHARLLEKLRAHGINGKVWDWISNWLSNRKQRTVINGKTSEWSKVSSGVAQGSVLGPLLFLIYINDIDLAATLIDRIIKFADDTKIGNKANNDDDFNNMQETINKLATWADTWGMAFNATKCHVLHMGHNNPRRTYSMNGTSLPTSATEKDVGVIVSDNLKPSKHCAEAARKARGVLWQISKSFHYRDKHVFVNLYKRHVRCILEYASPAWAPWSQGDINILEKVQERMVNMIPSLSGTNYEEKLDELNIKSLAARRTRADLIQTFKIIKGIDNVNHEHWFRLFGNADRQTRLSSYPLNITIQPARKEVRKNFFNNRVRDLWNDLPNNVKDSNTVNQFKSRLDKHSQQIPLS